jgi:ribonuclease HII
MPGEQPSLRIEGRYFADGCSAVGGVDEVGRGAWAGPVSIGIAVVTPGCGRRLPRGVKDSKQLTAAERESLFGPLSRSLASFAVGHASNEECDELGMTAAQRIAASRAMEQLDVLPEVVLLDGRFDFLADRLSGVSEFPPVRTIVKGDATVKSIAAASIVAKVTRDRLMMAQSEHYPWYCFERNKGYPTPSHKAALAAWGCTPLHRSSWAFVDYLCYQPPGLVGSAARLARAMRGQGTLFPEDIEEDPFGSEPLSTAGQEEEAGAAVPRAVLA